MQEKFTVVMSVYRNDKIEWVKAAVESITSYQTYKPKEVLIVVDGPISEQLSELLLKYENNKEYNFRIIWLSENKGLGNALRIATELAKNDLIARMDSDDVSLPDRFEKQIKYLQDNPDCDLIGGQIVEFVGCEDNIVGKREVPISNEAVYKWMKKRCPFNHMTVMYRKSKVLFVGNYIDWHYNEDYYLWIRMAEAGYKFANLPDTLVNVRVGKDMYARRGGWKYFKSEKGLQDYMYKRNIISLPQYLFNVAVRFGVQVAMPNKVRGFIFQKLFRK